MTSISGAKAHSTSWIDRAAPHRPSGTGSNPSTCFKMYIETNSPQVVLQEVSLSNCSTGTGWRCNSCEGQQLASH